MATDGGKQPTFRTARAQRGHSARCAPSIDEYGKTLAADANNTFECPCHQRT